MTALCNIKGTNYAPSTTDNGLRGESLCHTARIPLGKNFRTIAILRHSNAKGKWYALIGKIAKTKLGLKEEGETDFINLKCPPDMVSILRQSPPFLPAYHMNKTHWLTFC